MSDTMTFNEWEKELGVIVVDATEKHQSDKMTRAEFEAEVYADSKAPHGVNWSDRTEFLEANGYTVNRKNMVDSTLSHKPAKKKK